MGIFSKFLSKIKVSDVFHKPDLEEVESELIAADLGADLARTIIEETRKLKSETPEEALQSVLLSH
jgi:fused signal recognition particle receptor